jgi:hypothetical protein
MHLLQQHTLDISCTSPAFGKEVQSVVASLLEKEFYPKLELLLNLYSLKNYIWKIDKLEIILPSLSKKNWKEEIVAQSLEQIESYLKLHFEDLEQNLSVIENYQTVFSQEIIAENIFFDFLKKGMLPENAWIKTLEELIIALEINDRFIQKLNDLFIDNPKTLIRFIYALPEEFKTKIEAQIDGFQTEFQELLRFALVSKANYFSSINLESWVDFMSWQFYFFKEKRVSGSSIYNTIQTLSSEYWDIKMISFLTLSALLNPEINRYKNNFLTINTDYISFWKIVLNHNNTVNTVEKPALEENNISENNKKTELETPHSKTENMIYVENAGLILFHPFLKSLFEQLELTKNEIWTSKNNQHKAIILTQFLIRGETKIGENELVLNKILCGFPIENVVNTKLEITPKEIKKCESLLLAVIEHWKIIKDTSIAGLRETFLQRKGKILMTENEKLELWVKQEGVDILLAQLPWGIEMIKTPWMQDFLQCYWN